MENLVKNPVASREAPPAPLRFVARSSFWMPESYRRSAWLEHAPFAYWLIEATRPGTFVELGTHNGFSFLAFCQAIDRLDLTTRAYAIDHWRGDEHSGFYGEEVYGELKAYVSERYGSFASLVRSSFQDALPHFQDGTVDLLHIDGRHFYEDVKEDFYGWLPKMSGRGIVLFHDTNVRERDFGVSHLFDELAETYPNFFFLHGHGLGILGVGADLPECASGLFLTSGEEASTIRNVYARLGRAVALEQQKRQLLRDHGTLENRRAEAERARSALEAEHRAAMDAHAALEAEHAALEAEFAGVRAALERECENARKAAATLESDLGAAREIAAKVPRLEAELKKASEQHERWRGERERLREWARSLARSSASASAQSAAEAANRVIREAVAEALWLRRKSQNTGWLLKRLARQARHWPRDLSRRLRGKPRKRPPGEIDESLLIEPQSHVLMAEVAEPAAPASGRASPRSAAPSVRPVALLVSGEGKTPGHIYRVERHAASLREAGFDVSTLMMEEIPSRLDLADPVDLLVIWRARWSDDLARFIQRARAGGAKVVFDLDDLMIDVEIVNEGIIDAIRMNKYSADAVRQHYSSVNRTMKAADLCTATTRELAWQMQKWGMPALVLPNGYDEDTYHRSQLAHRRRLASRQDGLFRIGYAGGSRTHQSDLRQCIGAVADVLREKPEARLVLFRKGDVPLVEPSEFPELEGLDTQIEWRQMVPLRELPDEIARFDVNLAPLEVGNPFCEAKSELKFFEAALVRVCTIASPTGPFARLVRHGETGMLARTPAEWREALFSLAEDAAFRSRLAAAAELSVLWPHGPMRRRHAAAALIDHAAGGRAAARAMRMEITEREKISTWTPPAVFDHEVVFESDKLKASRVTVVIPLYNYEQYIVEALDSVAAQDLADIDLVVVDDASTDDSLARSVEWAKARADRFNRVLVVTHLENRGLGAARNTGFSLASSLWIMALDADNRLRKSCCTRCLATADASGAAFVYPAIQKFGDADSIFGGQIFMPTRLSAGNYIDAMALVSKEAWSAVGGYVTARLGWEDYVIWLSMVERGLHGEPISDVLTEYRVHKNSMLRTSTDMLDHKKKVISFVEERHVWTGLISEPRTGYGS